MRLAQALGIGPDSRAPSRFKTVGWQGQGTGPNFSSQEGQKQSFGGQELGLFPDFPWKWASAGGLTLSHGNRVKPPNPAPAPILCRPQS